VTYEACGCVLPVITSILLLRGVDCTLNREDIIDRANSYFIASPIDGTRTSIHLRVARAGNGCPRIAGDYRHTTLQSVSSVTR
jgi:hypothetical protein